jgi:hypothetical protein
MTKTVKNELGIRVGDFFVSSWGYDQTNIDFYKVVAVTAKGVRVQPWQSHVVDSESFHDRVIPGSGPRMVTDWSNVDREADYWTQQDQKVEREAPTKFHRTVRSGDSVFFTVNSYSNAYLWEGKSYYQTASNFGH